MDKPGPISLVVPKPNEQLVTYLEDLLAKARAGEVIGIAGVRLNPDNRFGTMRVGYCSDLELAGALAFAQHDLMAKNGGGNG